MHICCVFKSDVLVCALVKNSLHQIRFSIHICEHNDKTIGFLMLRK